MRHTLHLWHFRKLSAAVLTGSLFLTQIAYAVSSWSPTLLVNTESFNTIEDGDGSTDIEMRFGGTLNEKIIWSRTEGAFQFTDDISVLGNMSGSSLNVDRNATIGGTLTATGAATFQGNATVKGTLSGAKLRVSGGGADVQGTLAASGAVRTDSDLTINDDQTAADAVLTFGQPTTNQTLKYLNSSGKFQFSNRISVLGTMSGSSLNVDRNATIGGTLTATGAATFKSTVSADGDMTLNADQTAADALLTFGQPTTNQTLKYLNTSNRFQFSKGVSVVGHLSGASLNVDRNATVGGTLTASGAATLKSTLTVDSTTTVKGTISGAALNVSRNATVGGTLTATGAIRTKNNLSGSTLNVDGAFNWRGIEYTAPTSQSSNTYLKTDGAGALTWSTASVANGSGGILSLHPEYPNTVYTASGSAYIGQLTASGSRAGTDNTYYWTTTKATLQDYWIAVRVRLPDNFSSWDPVKPIELRYRTKLAAAANNHVTIRMKDTENANVSLTGGGGLASATFATASVTGPQAAGTWTAKGYFTIFIKVASDSTGFAEVGFLNLNFETTTP